MRLLLACLLLTLLVRTARAERIPDGAFVRVSGTGFVAGGRPIAVVGANFDPMHGEHNRQLYRATLAALANDGLNVGRMWVVGEGMRDAPDWTQRWELFRAGPYGFIEEAYIHLDHVLAAAREQGVRLIITLSNHWGDYGGVPMYLRWAGLPMDGLNVEEFYRSEPVRNFYRAGVMQLLERTNTVTGVRYVDDPTIFAWELMNESNVVTTPGAEARRAWIAEMIRFIKNHDPNHLVGPGLLGYAMRSERAEWVRVHKLPEVDYCDSHLYPETAGTGAQKRLLDFLDDRAQLARFVIGKPMIMGEFGFRTDGGKLIAGLKRAAWFGKVLDRLFYSGAAGGLAWIYEPFSGKPRDYGIYTNRADTDDVRAALSHRARRVAAGPPPPQNERLSAARGEALLYDPLTVLAGTPRAHRGWQRTPDGDDVLAIAPDAFAGAVFERAGAWKGGNVAHVYGAESGRFIYRFAAPPGSAVPPAALQIEARVSSEWPGTSAPPDGGSPVRVLLDGVEVGRIDAMPDDGLGRPERVIVDRAHLGRLGAGVHTLTFEVPEVPAAHGLCIYGDLTGNSPVPKGEFGPIRLRYLRTLPAQAKASDRPNAPQGAPR